MSLSLILASLWAIAVTCVAFLPMRLQFAPGLALLVLAVPLMGFVAWQHGVWLVLLMLAGLVSMFRRPLIYFGRKALDRHRGERP